MTKMFNKIREYVEMLPKRLLNDYDTWNKFPRELGELYELRPDYELGEWVGDTYKLAIDFYTIYQVERFEKYDEARNYIMSHDVEEVRQYLVECGFKVQKKEK